MLNSIVYKACRKSIVTLELLDDTITNEKRDGVVDKNYAKFRCNKAKVINITYAETGETMTHDVSIYDNNFEYRVGKVITTYFNKNINIVCTEGIHYFKTKEAALSWFYQQVYKTFPNGKWTKCHKNGQKESEGTYKDGKKDGKWTEWYEDGQKKLSGSYKNGTINRYCVLWDEDGRKVE